jgi:hypothetical protein
MNSQRLVKLLLRLFIASIVAMAAVGLYVIAIPSDDWEYEIKILLTTAAIAGASICGLACGGCMMRGRRMLPTIGLVLSVVSAGLTLVGVWASPWDGPSNWDFWEIYWKFTAVVIFYAIACAHLSMLLMARLDGMYRWTYLVAYYLILGLATVLSFGVALEFFEEEGYWRLTGALSILVAAITLLVPVFHWLSRKAAAVQEAEVDQLFAVEEELARVKKRLIELENKRRILLGREQLGIAEGPITKNQ